MKKVAVVLSGCGVLDGAEIHEAVLTLLALDRRDAEIAVLAPDMPQMHVVNHLSGQAVEGRRNVLIEAARIARGKISDLAQADIAEFDAVVFPGGFGVAKNLCDFAVKGPDCDVQPAVERFIRSALDAGKAMGFICIAPALLARVAGSQGLHPRLTIGTDADTATAVEKTGAVHVAAQVGDVVIDERLRIVSTPAYMLGQRISEVAAGIDRLVEKLLEMA
ncbi:MAG: isoprenoid biosynthesis glyoxalase ElbB [Acidobacteriota bacterium]|jgi:enhancing lycopene biosynthesis protein 2|nr:isoprenoid biosynthesis glyoxalase ElbB [Acidobacteriota bacterium]